MSSQNSNTLSSPYPPFVFAANMSRVRMPASFPGAALDMASAQAQANAQTGGMDLDNSPLYGNQAYQTAYNTSINPANF